MVNIRRKLAALKDYDQVGYDIAAICKPVSSIHTSTKEILNLYNERICSHLQVGNAEAWKLFNSTEYREWEEEERKLKIWYFNPKITANIFLID